MDRSLKHEVKVWPDAAIVAKEAAALLARWIAEALEGAARCRVALSGGSTPLQMNRALATTRLPWMRVDFFFTDERCVPPDHVDSNFRGAQETLFGPLGISGNQIFRMKGEADPQAASAEYERSLPNRLDIVVLGIGEDGHTCSLFPEHPLTRETKRRVAVIEDSPKPPPKRLTLTPKPVQEAGKILMLAVGAGKATAVRRALFDAGTISEVPARLARDGMWYLDSLAAAELPQELKRGEQRG